jgi:hypothetical protein
MVINSPTNPGSRAWTTDDTWLNNNARVPRAARRSGRTGGMKKLAVFCVTVLGAVAAAAPAAAHPRQPAPPVCPPAARATGFSDGLDKLVRNGATLGGLSSIAWDRRAGAWASTVDNHGTDPARIWFFTDAAHPVVTRDPLVLRRPDGTAFDGTTADDEGLVVLPDGDYLVSSETEPSIRIFGRDGVQKSSLPVPARFQVAPAGEATANATLEGLTITPDGKRVIAAMEGALSGDGDATLHRFLVYDLARHGRWALVKQIAYRTAPGFRISEISSYERDALVVMEAAFDPVHGNSVDLFTVHGVGHAPDVSGIAELSTAPARVVLPKSSLADLVKCPTLGATAKQPQANPLLDNYEGMAVVRGRHADTIELISDDNFGATQITRVLTLTAHLR